MDIRKDDLVTALKKDGWVGKQAKEAVELVLTSITGALASGGKVTLQGLGTFSVKETKARAGRNPKTGATIQIPAGRKVKFTPSKGLLG